jgi:hypothetical protein
MPFLRRVSACACVYRHTTSPRLSLWKSQGETTTMSPSRIQTRRFILPRIRHNRSLPSWHFTMMRSKPSSFTTTPKTSPCEGYTISLSWPSLRTFFLPKYCTSGLLVLEEWFTFLKSVIILLWYIRSSIPLTGNVPLRNLQSKRAITALE